MSTIKISELSQITPLNPNTANVVFVVSDTELGETGKLTAGTLAAGLFANTALNVGNNAVIFPGTIGQFASNNESYLQVNLQNLNGNGSSDFIATADIGTDSTYYIDLGIQGSTDTSGVLKPLDGYILLQGDTSSNPGGNLVIATETSGKDIIFAQGGIESGNVVAKFVSGTGFKLLTKPLFFADGTSQNTSFAAAATYANAAFGYANSAYTTANSAGSYANAAFLVANTVSSAFSKANSAYDTANNALANTTGTFGGSLYITGNANVGSHLIVANGSYDYANTSLVKISGAIDSISPPSNPGYMLEVVGINGVASRIINTGYGTGAYGLYAGRHANGTAASPTAASSNDVLARFSGGGHNGSAFTSTGQGRIDIVADEDFSTANTGSRIEFYNTIPKTNTVTKIATFNSNTASFTGAVYPNKGFIYTPRVVSGNTTSLVIDFSTDSMVKMQCNADCTVSFTNYTAGKVVEVWITNVHSSQHTVTHGCSSTNATNNGTTKALPATSSMKLQYFSIDGDLANTFVAVTQG
jgi:hypothetical protein